MTALIHLSLRTQRRRYVIKKPKSQHGQMWLLFQAIVSGAIEPPCHDAAWLEVVDAVRSANQVGGTCSRGHPAMCHDVPVDILREFSHDQNRHLDHLVSIEGRETPQ